MNQVKLTGNRRPFYRGNRNGRNPMRSLRHTIDDEQSLGSAQGSTFSYFSGKF